MIGKKRVKRLENAAEQMQINSLFTEGVQSFKKDKVAMIALVILVLICTLAIITPLFGLDYEALESRRVVDGVTYKPPYSPSVLNLFGTDELGRDLLVRVLYGLRVSLFVGVVARGGSMLLGLIIGVTAGYFGGIVETVLMRITDITLAFPAMLVAMAITFVLDPGIVTVCIAIALVGWPDVARIMRGQTLVLKNKEYVKAARALGISNIGIILKHILPNSLSLILVNFSLGIPGAIMYESGLSFFGFGIRPPMPSLGTIISSGRSYVQIAPWYVMAPGICLVVLVLCFNLLGDGLLDAFDPHAKKKH